MDDPQTLQTIEERLSNLELLVKTNREVLLIITEELNIRLTMLELRIKKLMQNSHRHEPLKPTKNTSDKIDCNKCGNYNIQNKTCSYLFQNPNGNCQAYAKCGIARNIP